MSDWNFAQIFSYEADKCQIDIQILIKLLGTMDSSLTKVKVFWLKSDISNAKRISDLKIIINFS